MRFSHIALAIFSLCYANEQIQLVEGTEQAIVSSDEAANSVKTDILLHISPSGANMDINGITEVVTKVSDQANRLSSRLIYSIMQYIVRLPTLEDLANLDLRLDGANKEYDRKFHRLNDTLQSLIDDKSNAKDRIQALSEDCMNITEEMVPSLQDAGMLVKILNFISSVKEMMEVYQNDTARIDKLAQWAEKKVPRAVEYSEYFHEELRIITFARFALRYPLFDGVMRAALDRLECHRDFFLSFKRVSLFDPIIRSMTRQAEICLIVMTLFSLDTETGDEVIEIFSSLIVLVKKYNHEAHRVEEIIVEMASVRQKLNCVP